MEEPARATAAGFSRHTVRLAGILSIAYLLVVAYASLHPFQGWRVPPREVLRFLVAPWPYFITLQDVLVNFSAYIPLGLLLSVGWGARLGATRGVLAAALSAALLSVSMEAAQMFLPSRIASNVDLAANSAGALMGAMAAPLLAPGTRFGTRLHALRHRLFVEGLASDVALVVAALWLLTQFHSSVPVFGSGDVRDTLGLALPLQHTASLAFTGEALVALFSISGVGLLLSAFMRDGTRRWRIIAAAAATALVIRLFTGAELHKLAFPLGQVTPGVVTGVCAAGALLFGALRLPRAGQLAVALLCVLAATAVINVAPENPYQSVPALLLAPGAGHVLSFTAIARALSEMWPALAVAFLVWALARATGGPGAHRI